MNLSKDNLNSVQRLTTFNRVTVHTDVHNIETILFITRIRDYFGINIRILFAPNYSRNDELLIFDCRALSAGSIETSLENAVQQCPSIRIVLLDADTNQNNLISKYPQIIGVFEDCAPDNLKLKGIKHILEGGLWLPRDISERLISRYRSARPNPDHMKQACSELTSRESELLIYICNGLSNSDIAEQLNLSENTIKSHLYSAYRKIGVKNRIAAMIWVKSQTEEPAI